MKYIIPILIGLAVLLSASKKRPVHLFMAGDSTMAIKPLYKNVWDSIANDSVQEPFLETGWGQVLPQFFNDKIVVDNYAKNGRSTRTFISEGLWDKLIKNVQQGDYVVIQFGHNDSSKDKVDRYTSPEDYKNNLLRFINEVKAKGGNPIVCTSVARRKFDENGVLVNSHGVYTDLAIAAAHETKTPLIDMHEKSKRVLTGYGVDGSTTLFLHVEAGQNRNFPSGKVDNTHFIEKGAKEMALLFIEGLRELNIKRLTKELKND
ncbi:MAG: hypothetical protein RL662_1288 [Bacteroidota bacterium]